MAPTRFGVYRERLFALRARLQGDMTQLADGVLSKDQATAASVPTDLAELGTDNSIQDLTFNLLGNEKDVLDQIRAALERIDDGSYGRCEECGKTIPEARLEALPQTPWCVRCAADQEQDVL
jgi:DnaK suppressor protein